MEWSFCYLHQSRINSQTRKETWSPMNRFTQVEACGTTRITSCSSRQYNRKRAGIDALVRGSSTRSFSSQALDWYGVCLEFHDASPTERSEASSADHVTALFTNHRALEGRVRSRPAALLPIPTLREPSTYFLPGGFQLADRLRTQR
jgi:hypothetical protein